MESPAERAVSDHAVPPAGSAVPTPGSLPQIAAGNDTPSAPTDPSGAATTVEVRRQSDNVKLVFPFAIPTSGAVFRRADTLWAVFDTATKTNIDALQKGPSKTIAGATVFSGPATRSFVSSSSGRG